MNAMPPRAPEALHTSSAPGEALTMTVPLSQLRFGHEHPLGDINIRKSRRFDDTEQLTASIAADGILQSLLVTSYEGDDFLYAIAGNRRLHAARQCLSVNNAPVIALHNLSVDDAIALGLAEELPKVPPHAVDRFEAFSAMARENKSPAEIASRYGVSEITVKRALAIGRIPHKIREAWRAGEIEAGVAQAFTLARDDKQAEKTFDRLKKQGALQQHNIRGALVPAQGDALRDVNFIGLDAYRAAGGAVIVDLFEAEHVVSDPALAAELAGKKLKDLAQTLVFEQGWAWAAPRDTLPSDWRSWSDPFARLELKFTKEEQKRLNALQEISERDDDDEYERADAEGVAIEEGVLLRTVTPDQKAKAGVVLILHDSGRVLHSYRAKPAVAKKSEAKAASRKGGKVMPDPGLPFENVGKRTKAAAADDDSKDPSLSNKHRIALGITLTEAAVLTLRQQPELATLIILAGVAAGKGDSYYPPLRLAVNGLAKDELQFTTTDVVQNLECWGALKPVQRDELLAQVAAATLGFNHFGNAEHALADPEIDAICNRLDPELMRDALNKRFDAEDYFAKAPKAFAIGAIAEVCGDSEARARETKPKSEIVKFALANIAGTGWLPRELRTAHYAGPGSFAKAPAKATKTKILAAKPKTTKRGKS